MDLWSRSSGDDKTLVKAATLPKVELWSRSSGDDEALVAGLKKSHTRLGRFKSPRKNNKLGKREAVEWQRRGGEERE